MFMKLVSSGYVESSLVFEGFPIQKYRITPIGPTWLAALYAAMVLKRVRGVIHSIGVIGRALPPRKS